MNKRILLAALVLIVSSILGCGSTANTQSAEIGGQADRLYDSSAAETNMRLGINYMDRGDYAIALDKFEKSLQQNPNLPATHNGIALLYQRLGENAKAEQHFKKAVSLDSNYSEAQNNYGAFLCMQRRYPEAEKHFLAAVKNPLYKSKAGAYENAGLCALRAEDKVSASRYFHEALQVSPYAIKSLLGLAQLEYDQGYYQEADGYLQRYYKIAPNAHSPQSLLLSIKIANKMGDKDTVASDTLLLRDRFPDSDEAQQVKTGRY